MAAVLGGADAIRGAPLSYEPQFVLRTPRLEGIVMNAKGRGRNRSAAAQRRPAPGPFTFFTRRVRTA